MEYPQVVDAARTAGLTEWLPVLVQLDLTSPSAVLSRSGELANHGMSDAEIRALLLPLKSSASGERHPPNRADFPVITPSAGGSLDRALAAAQHNTREQALKNLENDVYARSNSGPQVSRMRTWRKLAAAWNLPPLPITPDLLRAVGASFKAGGYRSSHLYFGTAKKQRILEYGTFPQNLEVLMQDVIRSIERGQGPGKLKDSFSLKELTNIDLEAHETGFIPKLLMVILGCHFLTREIELAATLYKHLQVDTSRQTVTWTLPASKTDCKGGLIARAHKCMCAVADPRLCPYHSAVELLKTMPPLTEDTGEMPLFSRDMETLTKTQTIEDIREVLIAAGIQTTREGTDGPVERFHGHCLRVSGVQYLTHLNFSTSLVMLMGRWGSQAILRYIQDAPLSAHLSGQTAITTPTPATPIVAGPGPSEQQFKKLKVSQQDSEAKLDSLSQRVSDLADEVSRINYKPAYIVGRKTHFPDPKEGHTNPRLWASKCGWAYGLSKFRRTDIIGDRCMKCFGLQSEQTQDPAEDSYSSSDSSSS